jgi:hypothetical protein
LADINAPTRVEVEQITSNLLALFVEFGAQNAPILAQGQARYGTSLAEN